jgi:hypothetical protein
LDSSNRVAAVAVRNWRTRRICSCLSDVARVPEAEIKNKTQFPLVLDAGAGSQRLALQTPPASQSTFDAKPDVVAYDQSVISKSHSHACPAVHQNVRTNWKVDFWGACAKTKTRAPARLTTGEGAAPKWAPALAWFLRELCGTTGRARGTGGPPLVGPWGRKSRTHQLPAGVWC